MTACILVLYMYSSFLPFKLATTCKPDGSGPVETIGGAVHVEGDVCLSQSLSVQSHTRTRHTNNCTQCPS